MEERFVPLAQVEGRPIETGDGQAFGYRSATSFSTSMPAMFPRPNDAPRSRD